MPVPNVGSYYYYIRISELSEFSGANWQKRTSDSKFAGQNTKHEKIKTIFWLYIDDNFTSPSFNGILLVVFIEKYHDFTFSF